MKFRNHLFLATFLSALFLFSGCDVIKELNKIKTAAQLQKGVSKIEGDNNLPGAQKGGVKLSQESYKIAVVPQGIRYKDPIFSQVHKKSEVYANNAIQFDGTPINLVMDIYSPAGDQVKGRPCVIFVFGGGWFMKTVDGMAHFGHQFAQKGFVGVSIDYRYGFPKATTMAQCKTEWSDFDEAWYRAAQDAKAAIRYVKANADRLGIDKNKIFIGGHSAGAYTSLNAVQLDDEDVIPALREKLGNLNSVGKHQNETTDVIGNYVLSGGTMRTMNFIDKKVPTYLISGTCDELLPYGSGKAYHCDNSPKHPITYTGPQLYEKYKSIGACVHLDVYCRGGHGYGAGGWKNVNILVGDFVYKVLTNKCMVSKRAIEAAQPACKTVDPTICKPAN